MQSAGAVLISYLVQDRRLHMLVDKYLDLRWKVEMEVTLQGDDFRY